MAARLRPFSLLRCKEIESHVCWASKEAQSTRRPEKYRQLYSRKEPDGTGIPQFRIPPIPACSATNMPPEPGRSPSTEASSDAEHDQVLGETATTALTAEGAAEIFKMKRDHVRRDTMSAKVCADHARLAARCVCHACVHFRLRANNASACLASC
jgi:hypothetical protein